MNAQVDQRRMVRGIAVLTAHIRKDIQGCICGWADLGKSHIDHLVDQLLDAGVFAPGVATTAPAAQPGGYKIDVRGIVLNIVGASPEAHRAYLHDPAMHHGVEVTIGVLGRAADVLTTTGGHSHPEAAELIREIAVACSHRGGPEDEHALALANSQMYPPPRT